MLGGGMLSSETLGSGMLSSVVLGSSRGRLS